MSINLKTIKGDLKPIGNRVLVSDMHFGEQKTKAGLIVLDDDGTGDGGINLTNSMGSANYTITAASEDNGASASVTGHDLTQGTKTASGYDFEVTFVNAGANRTNTDCETMSAIHGDLA